MLRKNINHNVSRIAAFWANWNLNSYSTTGRHGDSVYFQFQRLAFLFFTLLWIGGHPAWPHLVAGLACITIRLHAPCLTVFVFCVVHIGDLELFLLFQQAHIRLLSDAGDAGCSHGADRQALVCKWKVANRESCRRCIQL